MAVMALALRVLFFNHLIKISSRVPLNSLLISSIPEVADIRLLPLDSLFFNTLEVMDSSLSFRQFMIKTPEVVHFQWKDNSAP